MISHYRLRSVSLLFLILWTSHIHSQQLYLIPKAGVSVHSLRGSSNREPMEDRSDRGVMAGAALEIGLSEQNRWAFQPEIFWVQKGCKLVNIDPLQINNYYNEVYKINYLEIPLLVKTTFGKSRIQLFINAGPSMGIGTGGKHIYLDNPYSGAQGGEVKIRFSNTSSSSDTRVSPRIDWSVQAGGGISYKVGAFMLLAEGRYGLGLNSIKSTHTGSPFVLLASHHRFLLVNLGVAIPLNNQ